MLNSMAKNGHWVAFATLFLYLSCTFQPALLEGLHFISHLGEMNHHDYESHGLNGSNNHDHDYLEFFEIAFDHNPDNQTNQDETSVVKLKKSPETGSKSTGQQNAEPDLFTGFPEIINAYQPPGLAIVIPPPKVLFSLFI